MVRIIILKPITMRMQSFRVFNISNNNPTKITSTTATLTLYWIDSLLVLHPAVGRQF